MEKPSDDNLTTEELKKKLIYLDKLIEMKKEIEGYGVTYYIYSISLVLSFIFTLWLKNNQNIYVSLWSNFDWSIKFVILSSVFLLIQGNLKFKYATKKTIEFSKEKDFNVSTIENFLKNKSLGNYQKPEILQIIILIIIIIYLFFYQYIFKLIFNSAGFLLVTNIHAMILVFLFYTISQIIKTIYVKFCDNVKESERPTIIIAIVGTIVSAIALLK